MQQLEKRLVKGGIYGFILGLFLAVLLVSDEIAVRQSGTLTESVQLPLRDYVMKLLRYACGFSLATAGGLWLQDWMKRDKSDKSPDPSFWGGFVKAFLIVFGVILLLLLAASLWKRVTS